MTDKRYTLPDGAEVRTAESNLAAVPTLANHTWVIHPTLGAISCYEGLLMPVLPPLPPEPPIGTVLLDGGDRAWQRVRDDRDPQWRHDSLMCSWETMVRENGPLTLLVVDPAVDAPPLPWRKLGSDDRYPADLLVERARDAGDVLEINGFRLAANQIRELMGICARHLKPGAERDALQAAAWAAREVQP